MERLVLSQRSGNLSASAALTRETEAEPMKTIARLEKWLLKPSHDWPTPLWEPLAYSGRRFGTP